MSQAWRKFPGENGQTNYRSPPMTDTAITVGAQDPMCLQFIECQSLYLAAQNLNSAPFTLSDFGT